MKFAAWIFSMRAPDWVIFLAILTTLILACVCFIVLVYLVHIGMGFLLFAGVGMGFYYLWRAAYRNYKEDQK